MYLIPLCDRLQVMLRNYALEPSAPSNTDVCPVIHLTPVTGVLAVVAVLLPVVASLAVAISAFVLLRRYPGASKSA